MSLLQYPLSVRSLQPRIPLTLDFLTLALSIHIKLLHFTFTRAHEVYSTCLQTCLMAEEEVMPTWFVSTTEKNGQGLPEMSFSNWLVIQ